MQMHSLTLSGEFIMLHAYRIRLLQVAASAEVKLITYKRSRCSNSNISNKKL